MSPPRRMHLNAVIFGLGSHEAGWRLPESDPLASTSLDYWVDIARRAEAADFDALFLGDVLALQSGADRHLSDAMDPLVILSALAAVTSRIGLIGTASTSFDHPFHLARRFASLDHISKGRAGWNIVTSSNVLEARNFGLDAMPEHDERYARAADVVDAAIALWQSWAPDARTPDKAAGRYFDPDKVRPVDHAGPFVRTAGLLNVPRSPQGRPLLAQAGSSEAGRAFAARYADIVFTVQATLTEAQDFYRDVKSRAAAVGRDPNTILVFPGIVPIVAHTRQAAEERLAALNGFTVTDHVLAKLGEFLGEDLANAEARRAATAPVERTAEPVQPEPGRRAGQDRKAGQADTRPVAHAPRSWPRSSACRRKWPRHRRHDAAMVRGQSGRRLQCHGARHARRPAKLYG